MKHTVIRTAIVTSLLTALVVSALGYFVVPRLLDPQPALAFNDPANQPMTDQAPPPPPQRPALRTRTYSRPAAYHANSDYNQAPSYNQDPYYGEPVVHHHRSTATSVAIVAGSAGTGAAIGAIAGGGKGAAIGALSGGAAGFIYDRLTANK